jgi:hypothetical protein
MLGFKLSQQPAAERARDVVESGADVSAGASEDLGGVPLGQLNEAGSNPGLYYLTKPKN